MFKKIKNFLLINSSEKQTVVKNTFWLFMSEGGMRFLKLLIFIYAARKLGASEWGIFSYVLALIGFFSAISDVGINSVLTREISKKDENGEHFVSTSFFLKVITSLAASVGLLIFSFFIKNSSEIKILFPTAIAILFLDSMREFGFAINRAYEKMELETFTKISATLVIVIAGFILIPIRSTALYFINAYLAGSIVGIVIMYVTLHPHFKEIRKNYKSEYLLPILKEAWPIAMVYGFSVLMANIDTIILGIFKSSYEVGLYSAAQKPSQVMYVVPVLLNTAFLPFFSRIAKIEKDRTNLIIAKTIRVTLLVCLPMVVGGIVLGNELIVKMFGAEYANAASVFQILIVGIISVAMGGVISNVLFAQENQKKTMFYVVSGAIVDVILCLVLIPRFGMYGAAISATVSTIFIYYKLYRDFKVKNGTVLNMEYFKLFFALLVMVIAIFGFRKVTNLYLTILLSAGSYLAALLLVKNKTVFEVRDIFLKNQEV